MLLGPSCTQPLLPESTHKMERCKHNEPKYSAPFDKYFRAFVNLRDIMSKLKLRLNSHSEKETPTHSSQPHDN
ncbi:CLUMA_CG012926, isoform A [Clunio marinus]|uniref:CLUMA_CG012926, isoform A n=1 Tax=Clunio marinus TaxID=568069 RepID=A0A1J1IKK5_9DIPT|nr:CLUMA_CG012926, isoform A [Clunio marinus]